MTTHTTLKNFNFCYELYLHTVLRTLHDAFVRRLLSRPRLFTIPLPPPLPHERGDHCLQRARMVRNREAQKGFASGRFGRSLTLALLSPIGRFFGCHQNFLRDTPPARSDSSHVLASLVP